MQLPVEVLTEKKNVTIFELEYRVRPCLLIWLEYFSRNKLKFSPNNVPAYSDTFNAKRKTKQKKPRNICSPKVISLSNGDFFLPPNFL